MNFTTHALLLTGYAATVATCAPRLLSQSSLPTRSPGFALALWHTSIGSAGFAISLAALKLMSAVRFLPPGRPGPSHHMVPLAETLATIMIGLLIAVFLSVKLTRSAVRLRRTQRAGRFSPVMTS